MSIYAKQKQIHRHRKQTTAAAKSLQSCPTLCDPIDGSPPGSPIPGFSRQEHWSGLPFRVVKWRVSRQTGGGGAY